MMMASIDADGDSRATPGRPRSARADAAILDATLDLMAEGGYAALTMEGIADRAGVGKATLYRRWKSPEEVIVAAVAAFVERIEIPDTGSVADDLLLLMRQAVDVYRGRPGRVLPGLLAAMAASDEVGRSVRSHFLEGRRAALATVLHRAMERGELHPDVDVELVLDFLGGPLFYRVLVTGGPLDDDLADGVVDVVLHGVAGVESGTHDGAPA
jgi:AcrR family transcriptional regulator